MDEKKEQYELIAQPTGLPFNSISEIVDDSIFRGFVRENISEDEAKQLHTNYLGFLLDRQKSRLI